MIAYIHPFGDGNGRTARAIFYWSILRSGYWLFEYVSISKLIQEKRSDYDKAFIFTETDDFDLTYFIDFCLDSMISALAEVSKKVGYLLRMNDLKERFNLSQTQVGLLQRMALHKFRTIDIEEYAHQISKSREFARQELKALLDLNLVFEIKVSKKLVYKVNAEKLKDLYKQETSPV